MAEFEILFSEGETKGLFSLYAPKEGHDVPIKSGEMTFSKAGTTTWIIDHTGVDDFMEGTGAAAALVKRGVELARERGVKIIPLCPFAMVQFKRHPDYADVLQG
ncbi:GNAT family N-acetyltransferase [Pararhizobium sp. IMCC21322]|uniref:GNAT family N-acetyltransferase n=1 Tax=Pararhizobium sp. IMCC21322 TaxID=3067903 RepID=UPI002741802B|nr:GNAT family N-acetyltransferase [Pararhizobium sp. IMCC21322]